MWFLEQIDTMKKDIDISSASTASCCAVCIRLSLVLLDLSCELFALDERTKRQVLELGTRTYFVAI